MADKINFNREILSMMYDEAMLWQPPTQQPVNGQSLLQQVLAARQPKPGQVTQTEQEPMING